MEKKSNRRHCRDPSFSQLDYAFVFPESPKLNDDEAIRRVVMKKWSIFFGAIFFLGILAGIAQATHTKFTQPLKIPPVLTTPAITINAVDADVPVLAGAPTKMWTLGGDATPPTIRRPTGQTTNLTFNHMLTEIKGPGPQGIGNGTQTGVPGDHSQLTIHHHGAHVAPKNDGWACGFYFGGLNNTRGNTITYTYHNKENDTANNSGNERAVTQWYHNHRVDVTGHTLWKGLGGGIFILGSDPAEATLPLPRGQYDVPLTIKDLQFNSSNQIPYNFNFNGVSGNHILVNGVPQPFFNVEPRKYRFRILGAANARKFFMRLRRSNSNSNISMTQIGTDAGLMAAPANRTEIPIGIAERVEIVIDFAPHASQNLILQNNDTANGQCVPGNCSTATREIMQFRVGTVVTDPSNNTVPSTLRSLPTAAQLTPITQRREIQFTREGDFWTLQVRHLGRSADDRITDCARTDADPIVNTNEEWTIRGVGNWTHSIHIHDVDQICVSHNGSSTANGCQTFNRMKETWPVPPNTTWVVRFKPTDFTQAAFDPDSTPCNSAGAEEPPNPDNTGECANVTFRDDDGDLTTPTFTPDRHGGDNVTGNQAAAEAAGGRYMIHCHVVEHEDLGMMTQWRVRSSPADGAVREVPCDPPGSCTN
jgi:FtsP/CotA-like multicopper oxidase with cupredoxin domain